MLMYLVSIVRILKFVVGNYKLIDVLLFGLGAGIRPVYWSDKTYIHSQCITRISLRWPTH